MTAKKLDNKPAQTDHGIKISSFSQFRAALLTDSQFQSYQTNSVQDECVSIQKGSAQILVFSEEAWRKPESIVHLFPEPLLDEACIVLFSNAQVNDIPAPWSSRNYQILLCPLELDFLAAFLDNLVRLSQRLNEADKRLHSIELASQDVKHMLSISRELNGERDLEKLLSLILKKAREVTCADAGSIYTLDAPTKNVEDWTLRFRYTQNDSIEQNLSQFTMKVTRHSIVGNVVLNRQPINIPDLYMLHDDPTKNPFNARHDKSWDLRIGYESHSMLTLPVFNIAYEVTGVIQLINRKRRLDKKLQDKADFQNEVVPFDEKDVEYGLIVGQQAGIALENASMTEEIQNLFDGFVNASVTAIEQRDPTTSGHSHRVAALTCELAKTIDRIDSGVYRGIKFSDDELKEIQYASLLHDFGKLGVRESVLVKAKKLYPWEMNLIEQRFEFIKATIEIEYLRKLLTISGGQVAFPTSDSKKIVMRERDDRLRQLEKFMNFVKTANEPTVLEQGGFERLNDIGSHYYLDMGGKKRPFLLDSELAALSVSRGSLTREEFMEIQSHVIHTFEFLRKIPWGKKLANIPNIAAKHHEYLDGTGYPTGTQGNQIPIQTRMMTIADIFDALTASDRPYKKAIPTEKALDILQMEVNAKKVDSDLLKIFIDSKIYNIIRT